MLSTGGWCPPDSPWGKGRSEFGITLLPSIWENCASLVEGAVSWGISGCQGWEGKSTTDV